VALKWHQDVNATYKRLIEIEQDATRATAANQRFGRLNAVRGEVSQYLDAILSRAKSITLDSASHPLLHMECEKIKAALAEISSPDKLHAGCDFAVNFLNIQIRLAETAYSEAANSNFLIRGSKRTSAASLIASALVKLRDQIEVVRFEDINESFQICPSCFSRHPRDYKRCGQCGGLMDKPFKLATN
jgi:hypothetical protein